MEHILYSLKITIYCGVIAVKAVADIAPMSLKNKGCFKRDYQKAIQSNFKIPMVHNEIFVFNFSNTKNLGSIKQTK